LGSAFVNDRSSGAA